MRALRLLVVLLACASAALADEYPSVLLLPAAAADVTAPVISGESCSIITSTGATCAWATDELADSQIDYGTTASYGSTTTLNPALVTAHSVAITGLSASTLYHWRAKSRDAAGNLRNGTDQTFTTAALLIDAVNDSGTATNDVGGTAVSNVRANDSFNGASPPGGGLTTIATFGSWPSGITLNTSSGAVSVAAGTAAGVYTPQYDLCEVAVPTNCDRATVTVTVNLPPDPSDDICTYTPFTSSTAWSTVASTISGASSGDVVCLQQGSSWASSGTALNLTASHPFGSDVLVCTSDSVQCIDGGTDAAIAVTSGRFATFGSGAGGYTFRNIDVTGSGTCNDTDGLEFTRTNNGNHDIAFEGVTVSGYGHVWLMCNHRTACGSTGENLRLTFGTLARKNTVQSCVSSSRWLQYGACKDCSFVFDLTGWGGTTGSGGFVHVLDFNLWTANDPDTENVTIEGGRWELASASTDIGSVIKAAYGKNMIFRNMEVVETEPTSITGTAPGGIHLEGHSTPTSGAPWSGVLGWEGARIYNNYFALGNSHQAIMLSRLGWDIDFYNNVIDSNGNMTPLGGSYVWITDGQTTQQAPPRELPNNVRVFNNTFYIPDASSAPILQSNVASTDNRAWNNLMIDDRATARIFESTCGSWGAGGANLHDNFVYSQNDATPNLGGCVSATWPPGGSYNTAPGIADTTPEVDDVQDFDITDSSAVSDIGSATPTFPATDHEGAAQTNPPSIGAFSELEP